MLSIKDYLRAKFVRLETGRIYQTGDISFLEGCAINLSGPAKEIVETEHKIRVEILGQNSRTVSCRIYFVTGVANFKLIESRGFRKSQLKRLIAQGVLT